MYPEWSLPEPVAVPRPVSADSARLFPEWSVPEPVAVPHGVNGMWGPAWLQQQEAAAQQPQHSMQLVSAQQHQLPATAALHTQPHIVHLDQQAGSQTQPGDTGQHQTVQQAAQQQPQNTQHMSAREPAPAAATQSADTFVQLQQQQHLSVSHVSLALPSTSEPADVKQLPTSAQPEVEQSHVLAQTVAQEPATVVQASMPLELHRQHQRLAQQQSEQQLHLRQQQEQGQRPLPEAPSGIDDVSSSKVEHGHQQPGTSGLLDAAPGPPDAAPMTVGPNVGAYSQRELFLQNLEQAGDMSFEYVLNDGQRHNSIWSVAVFALSALATSIT